MVFVLVLLFIVVPLAELAVILWVGSTIGIPETIAVLLVVSIVGAWLVKRAGVGVLGRIREQWARGVMPTVELIDAALILVAGTLLLLPGFLTDVVGLMLLVPVARAGVRGVLRRHFVGRVAVRNYTVRPPPGAEWRPPASPSDPYELQ
ncbi:MAG: FxsA family protein [Acidimicrobiia bacterium]